MRNDHYYCPDCLEKQVKIDTLEAEVERLKAKLRYQERTSMEGFFGSSTSSAKVPIKPNSLADRQARRGGARQGHTGHGRRKFMPDDEDISVERVKTRDTCPDCGVYLRSRGIYRRTVLDCDPLRVVKKILALEKKQCPACGRRVEARPAEVLPKSLYSNRLVSYLAIQHYLHGQTLGFLEKQTGLSYSGIIQALHGLANRLEPAIESLIEQYRKAAVKHADETSWRNDGQNGYAWLFATPTMSIFRFRQTRGAAVVREMLGPKRLPGVLVVDRYGAYNKAPCRIQYCYAHLLRAVEDLGKEFQDNEEVTVFVQALAPLLSAAMSVRTMPISTQQFRAQSNAIKRKIKNIINAHANHPGIHAVQDIFRKNAGRLYHWSADRRVPADNNLAERDVRPLVIARKISFGSQSPRGAKTRETLMTILNSLKKQTPDVFIRIKSALDQLACDSSLDPYQLLFNQDSS